ncbi:MAG: hypothetical protein H0Z40_01330 [Desulfotomaculum sp.]|nr:hypothetical protein [Desulfotomaculum sp.]
MLQVDYQKYMKLSNNTIEGTAFDLDISVRHMQRYLKHETPIPDDKVMEMTRIFGPVAAAMPFEHFTYQSEIGRKLYPSPLNSIDNTFPAFCFKAVEELEEMTEALQAMCRIVFNNRLMTESEAKMFDKLFREVLDVEQLCLEIKIKYAKLRGIEALESRVKEHKQKMVERGYHVMSEKEKRPAQVAEQRATYKYA